MNRRQAILDTIRDTVQRATVAALDPAALRHHSLAELEEWSRLVADTAAQHLITNPDFDHLVAMSEIHNANGKLNAQAILEALHHLQDQARDAGTRQQAVHLEHYARNVFRSFRLIKRE